MSGGFSLAAEPDRPISSAMQPPSTEVPDPTDEAGLSIGQLARATGIPASTLRAWESRYGAPTPLRRPSGHRRYLIEEVARLRCAAELVGQGLAPARALARCKAPEDAPEAHDPDLERALEHAAAFDTQGLTAAVERACARGPMAHALDEFVGPLLGRLGQLWADGAIGVRHEHACTAALVRTLHAIGDRMDGGVRSERLILALLPGDEHRLPLAMLRLVALARGYEPVDLGDSLPVEEIAAAAAELDAAAVLVHVSYAAGGIESDRELERLAALGEGRWNVVAGGAGSRGPRRGARGVVLLPNLVALDAWLNERVQRPSPPPSGGRL